jgi:hypothetical protein
MQAWPPWLTLVVTGLLITEAIWRFALTRWVWREVLRAFVLLDLRALKLLQKVVKPRYELLGACQQRGACCTQIVANPPGYIKRRPRLLATFAWFHRMAHNFRVVGRGPDDELIFKCDFLKQDGGCGIYRWRPRLCRVYPVLPFFAPPRLLPGCGYRTKLRGLKSHPRLPVLGGGHVAVHHPTPPASTDGALERPEDFVLVDTHASEC